MSVWLMDSSINRDSEQCMTGVSGYSESTRAKATLAVHRHALRHCKVSEMVPSSCQVSAARSSICCNAGVKGASSCHRQGS